MASSIQVKDKKEKTITLSIDQDQLVIESEKTKETISLEFIYGVTTTEEILKIHIAQKEEEWTLRVLEYKTDDVSFADRLRPALAQDTPVVAFINPSSGRRGAAVLWETVVRPMLETAGLYQFKTITTSSGGKTREQSKRLVQEDWPKNTVVLVLGGDGTVHEVINGLLDSHPSQPFRVGVIPAGSGNAFSMGLGVDGVIQATLRVIQGQTKPCCWMDVRLGHSEQERDWQDHMVCDDRASRLLVVMSWGFHAQIVSKARYLQYFMGNRRFSLVAGFLLAFLQQYSGELVLKNAVRYKGDLDAEREDKVIKEDQFTYFVVSKQPSLEKGFKIAPFASPLDSDMDIVLLRQANSKQLTEASIKAFQEGAHVDLDYVEYYKATELYLRVREKAELCLDGEVHTLAANGIIQLKAMGSNEPGFVVFV